MKEKHRGRKEDFGMGTVIIIWVAIIIAIRMAGKSMDKKMADDIRKAKGGGVCESPGARFDCGRAEHGWQRHVIQCWPKLCGQKFLRRRKKFRKPKCVGTIRRSDILA